MSDIPQSMPDQPVSLVSVGMRMVQIGFDQLTAMLAQQAKRIERDRAAAQRVCDTLMHARPNDAGAFALAWQTMMREYLAASVASWEEGLVCAARNQAAYGALLRDAVLDVEKAWMRGAPVQMVQQAGAVPQAGDWMTYLGRFMGGRPDGEPTPAKPEPHAASAGV